MEGSPSPLRDDQELGFEVRAGGGGGGSLPPEPGDPTPSSPLPQEGGRELWVKP